MRFHRYSSTGHLLDNRSFASSWSAIRLAKELTRRSGFCSLRPDANTFKLRWWKKGKEIK